MCLSRKGVSGWRSTSPLLPPAPSSRTQWRRAATPTRGCATTRCMSSGGVARSPRRGCRGTATWYGGCLVHTHRCLRVHRRPGPRLTAATCGCSRTSGAYRPSTTARATWCRRTPPTSRSHWSRCSSAPGHWRCSPWTFAASRASQRDPSGRDRQRVRARTGRYGYLRATVGRGHLVVVHGLPVEQDCRRSRAPRECVTDDNGDVQVARHRQLRAVRAARVSGAHVGRTAAEPDVASLHGALPVRYLRYDAQHAVAEVGVHAEPLVHSAPRGAVVAPSLHEHRAARPAAVDVRALVR